MKCPAKKLKTDVPNQAISPNKAIKMVRGEIGLKSQKALSPQRTVKDLAQVISDNNSETDECDV